MTVMVHIRHARAARLDHPGQNCAGGIRTWCRLHGVDLRRFATEGLPVEDIARIETAFARRMVELARAEVADGQE